MRPARNSHLPVWFTIIGQALASCSNPQPEAITLLKAAEQLTDSRPDRAVQLIDSIFYPEKSFNKRDYMRYWVTRVQVRYKNYLAVDEDTLIFKARDYFTKHSNDPMKTTLACFYSGCVYREQGNKEQAMKHYKDAETYAVKTSDVDLQGLVQYNMGDLLAEQGLYDQAFDYQQKYAQIVEKISQERLQQSVYDVQQKYDYNKQQNRNNLQLMHRQRLIIIFISFFLLVSLLSLFLLRRIVIQKNRLISVQNAVQTLNKTAQDLQRRQKTTNEKADQLRESLLWKFNVLHKSSLLKSELQQFDQMNTKHAIARFDEIVYGENHPSQWNTLVDTIDEMHPGLSSFTRSAYPQFTETEFKVCLLSYAGLPGKEIALLIDQSVHTVNMARTRIRQKMDLQEAGADFNVHLKKKFTENSIS